MVRKTKYIATSLDEYLSQKKLNEGWDLDDAPDVSGMDEFGKIAMMTIEAWDDKGGVLPHFKKSIGKVYVPGDEKKAVANKLPVLFRETKTARPFLDKSNLDTKYIYNDPREIKLGKVDSYKTVTESGKDPDWMPETYYDYEEAKKKIGFPMIAKVEEGHSSIGVELLKSDADFKKFAKEFKFVIFQKPISIKQEWRCVCFKGKNSDEIICLYVALRKPTNEKSKSLRIEEQTAKEKEMEEKHASKFTWVQLDIHKYPHTKMIKELAEFFYKANDGVWQLMGLDLAEDNDGKVWFIECNTYPGMPGNMLLLVYKAIYEDFYEAKFSKEADKAFQDLGWQYAQWTIDAKKGLFETTEKISKDLTYVTL